MARIARVVAVNFPHHVIQRGNRRQKVFFCDDDYKEYLKLLNHYCRKFKLDILSYCLMPNHVHLIVLPKQASSLAQAIGEAHRNYTRYINFREKWRGYLWQGRFSSYLLDENYLLAAVRYTVLNPVKAKIVKRAKDYQWSSLNHHIGHKRCCMINDRLLNGLIGNWQDFLSTDLSKDEITALKAHERTGRPLGNIDFINRLEQLLNISLKKKKPGPKRKSNNN